MTGWGWAGLAAVALVLLLAVALLVLARILVRPDTAGAERPPSETVTVAWACSCGITGSPAAPQVALQHALEHRAARGGDREAHQLFTWPAVCK